VRYFLRDHATKREAKQIDACKPEHIQKGVRMYCHTLDRLGHLAG